MRKSPLIVAGAPSSVASVVRLTPRFKPIGCGAKPLARRSIPREQNSAIPPTIFHQAHTNRQALAKSIPNPRKPDAGWPRTNRNTKLTGNEKAASNNV